MGAVQCLFLAVSGRSAAAALEGCVMPRVYRRDIAVVAVEVFDLDLYGAPGER